MSTGQRIRIIGGSARGRTVHSAAHAHVRPTPSALREALANMLRPRLAGSRVLDLCAGYGGVGLEFLSQGATEAVFIERDRRTADILRRNVDELEFDEQAEVWTATAEGAIERLVREGRSFDLIFVDPPYDEGLARKLLDKLAAWPALLAAGGLVIVQHSSHEPLPAAETSLTRTREKRAGETILSWYQPTAEVPEEAP